MKVIAVGKLKTKALADVASDYERRIRKYHPFAVVEVPDEAVRRKAPVEKILAKEALKIEKQIKAGSYLIALDERGTQWSSVEFADQLERIFKSAHREICFVIGGAHGLDASLKKEAQGRWSLSKLTLPHQLARVLALEQIYRALTLLRNVPYHNE